MAHGWSGSLITARNIPQEPRNTLETTITTFLLGLRHSHPVESVSKRVSNRLKKGAQGCVSRVSFSPSLHHHPQPAIIHLGSEMLSWTTFWCLVPDFLAITSQFATIVSGTGCVHEEPFELAARLAPTSLLIICYNWFGSGMRLFLSCPCPVPVNQQTTEQVLCPVGKDFVCFVNSADKEDCRNSCCNKHLVKQSVESLQILQEGLPSVEVLTDNFANLHGQHYWY